MSYSLIVYFDGVNIPKKTLANIIDGLKQVLAFQAV